MGLVLVATIGLIAWIVLWAIGWKAFDAFMITSLVLALGATARILGPYLPGRQ